MVSDWTRAAADASIARTEESVAWRTEEGAWTALTLIVAPLVTVHSCAVAADVEQACACACAASGACVAFVADAAAVASAVVA